MFKNVFNLVTALYNEFCATLFEKCVLFCIFYIFVTFFWHPPPD